MDQAEVHTIALHVKEEKKLPKTNDFTSDWTGQTDLHPFWAVKRQAEGNEINCKIVRQHVNLLVSMDFGNGLAKLCSKVPEDAATTMYVEYPFIVNEQPIPAGVEVVLLNTKPVPQETKKRKFVDAFDQLKSQYNKTAAPKKAASASA